ncbi:MAG: hypothetical protein ACLVBP_00510 [Ruminococcus sp.]
MAAKILLVMNHQLILVIISKIISGFKKDNAKLVTEVGKTYLEWSFVYNVDGKQPVKGNTVTDTLQDNEYTKFKKGDVIHVKRSDGAEFDITVPADGNTWSYTIGKNSGDNYTDDSLIYKYTFHIRLWLMIQN